MYMHCIQYPVFWYDVIILLFSYVHLVDTLVHIIFILLLLSYTLISSEL